MGCVESKNSKIKEFKIQNRIRKQFPDIINRQIKDMIQKCVDYKFVNYKQFFYLKSSLKQIIHKKIVQKIYRLYLPQVQMQCLIIDEFKGSGLNEFSMMQLVKCMIKLQYVSNLSLNFSNSYLNIQFKKLCYILQNLPNLVKLKLYLKQNELNHIEQGVQNLAISIQKLQSLRNLDLKLNSNLLGLKTQNFIYLGQGFRYLQNLQYLKLNLHDNLIGDNEQNIINLGNGLQYLKNLQNLKLNLGENFLGKREKNMENLRVCYQNLDNLTNLEIDLYNNILGDNQNNLKNLGESLSKSPKNLQHLNIVLSYNNMCLQVDNFKNLGIGLQRIRNLKCLDMNLNGNNIIQKIQYLSVLGDYLENLPCLRRLSLGLKGFSLNLNNDLQNSNLEVLINMIKKLKSLEELILDWKIYEFTNQYIQQTKQERIQIQQKLKQRFFDAISSLKIVQFQEDGWFD